VLCRQQAVELGALRSEIAERGAALVVIGSGTHAQARGFVETFVFAGEVYVDPKREAFQALGLYRGVLRTLGPSSLWQIAAARRAGFRSGRLAGDPWQQGGTFVLGPGENVRFAYRDRMAGDRARSEDVLGALPASAAT